MIRKIKPDQPIQFKVSQIPTISASDLTHQKRYLTQNQEKMKVVFGYILSFIAQRIVTCYCFDTKQTKADLMFMFMISSFARFISTGQMDFLKYSKQMLVNLMPTAKGNLQDLCKQMQVVFQQFSQQDRQLQIMKRARRQEAQFMKSYFAEEVRFKSKKIQFQKLQKQIYQQCQLIISYQTLVLSDIVRQHEPRTHIEQIYAQKHPTQATAVLERFLQKTKQSRQKLTSMYQYHNSLETIVFAMQIEKIIMSCILNSCLTQLGVYFILNAAQSFQPIKRYFEQDGSVYYTMNSPQNRIYRGLNDGQITTSIFVNTYFNSQSASRLTILSLIQKYFKKKEIPYNETTQLAFFERIIEEYGQSVFVQQLKKYPDLKKENAQILYSLVHSSSSPLWKATMVAARKIRNTVRRQYFVLNVQMFYNIKKYRNLDKKTIMMTKACLFGNQTITQYKQIEKQMDELLEKKNIPIQYIRSGLYSGQGLIKSALKMIKKDLSQRKKEIHDLVKQFNQKYKRKQSITIQPEIIQEQITQIAQISQKISGSWGDKLKSFIPKTFQKVNNVMNWISSCQAAIKLSVPFNLDFAKSVSLPDTKQKINHVQIVNKQKKDDMQIQSNQNNDGDGGDGGNGKGGSLIDPKSSNLNGIVFESSNILKLNQASVNIMNQQTTIKSNTMNFINIQLSDGQKYLLQSLNIGFSKIDNIQVIFDEVRIGLAEIKQYQREIYRGILALLERKAQQDMNLKEVFNVKSFKDVMNKQLIPVIQRKVLKNKGNKTLKQFLSSFQNELSKQIIKGLNDFSRVNQNKFKQWITKNNKNIQQLLGSHTSKLTNILQRMNVGITSITDTSISQKLYKQLITKFESVSSFLSTNTSNLSEQKVLVDQILNHIRQNHANASQIERTYNMKIINELKMIRQDKLQEGKSIASSIQEVLKQMQTQNKTRISKAQWLSKMQKNQLEQIKLYNEQIKKSDEIKQSLVKLENNLKEKIQKHVENDKYSHVTQMMNNIYDLLRQKDTGNMKDITPQQMNNLNERIAYLTNANNMAQQRINQLSVQGNQMIQNLYQSISNSNAVIQEKQMMIQTLNENLQNIRMFFFSQLNAISLAMENSYILTNEQTSWGHIKNALQSLVSKVSGYAYQNTDAQRSLKQISTLLDLATSTSDSLIIQKISKLKQEQLSLKKTLTQMSQALTQKQEQLKKVGQKNSKAVRQKQDQIMEKQKQLDHARSQIQKLVAQQKQLRGKINQTQLKQKLKTDISHLTQSQLQTLKSKLQQTARQLARLSSLQSDRIFQLQKQKNNIEQLRNSLSEANNKINMLERQKTMLNQNITRLSNQLSNAQYQNSQKVRETASSKNKTVSNLQKQLQNVKQKYQKASDQLTKTKQKLAQIQGKLDHQIQIKNVFEENNRRLAKQGEQIKRKLDEKSQQLRMVTEQKSSLEGQLKVMKSNETQNQTNIDKYKKQIMTLNQDLDRLKIKVNSAELNRQQLQKQIKQLKNRMGRSQEKEQKIRQLQKSLKKANAQIDTLAQQKRVIQTKNDANKDVLQKLQSKQKDLERMKLQLKEKQTKLDQYNSKIQMLTKQTETLKHSVIQNKNKIQKYKSLEATNKAQIDEQQSLLAKYIIQIEDLNRRYELDSQQIKRLKQLNQQRLKTLGSIIQNSTPQNVLDKLDLFEQYQRKKKLMIAEMAENVSRTQLLTSQTIEQNKKIRQMEEQIKQMNDLRQRNEAKTRQQIQKLEKQKQKLLKKGQQQEKILKQQINSRKRDIAKFGNNLRTFNFDISKQIPLLLKLTSQNNISMDIQAQMIANIGQYQDLLSAEPQQEKRKDIKNIIDKMTVRYQQFKNVRQKISMQMQQGKGFVNAFNNFVQDLKQRKVIIQNNIKDIAKDNNPRGQQMKKAYYSLQAIKNLLESLPPNINDIISNISMKPIKSLQPTEVSSVTKNQKIHDDFYPDIIGGSGRAQPQYGISPNINQYPQNNKMFFKKDRSEIIEKEVDQSSIHYRTQDAIFQKSQLTSQQSFLVHQRPKTIKVFTNLVRSLNLLIGICERTLLKAEGFLKKNRRLTDNQKSMANVTINIYTQFIKIFTAMIKYINGQIDVQQWANALQIVIDDDV